MMLLALVLMMSMTACLKEAPIIESDEAETSVQALSVANAVRWSDAATWPNGQIPGPDSDVVVPAGKHIVLDRSVSVKSLWIDGIMSFANADLELKTNSVMVHGSGILRIGSETAPFSKKATITLTDAASDSNTMSCGAKFVCVMMGGSIDWHGISAKKRSWTRLSTTLEPGNTTMKLSQTTNWAVGDEVVIAPSGYDHTQAEVVSITKVGGDGLSFEFSPALKFQHWGQIQTIEGTQVDQRAEVGLLTHNIMVRSAPESVEPFYNGQNALTHPGELQANANNRFGGHIMVMDGKAKVSGVVFRDLGQATRLGRYAFHWHLTGDGTGQYIKNSAVYNGYTRGIVVHGTRNAVVEGNVVYNTASHNYIFAEDGSESGNRIAGNLGIRTTLLPQHLRIFRDDPSQPLNSNLARRQDEHRPSNFWGLNANNTIINNAAGGGEGNGFHFAHEGRQADLSKFVFSGNTAHSNFQPNGGNDLYPPNTRGHGLFVSSVSGPRMLLQGFSAYKNNASGAWVEGDSSVLSGALLSDNNAGAMAFTSRIENSTIIGQTANINGKPRRLGEGVAGGVHLMRGQGGTKRPAVSNVRFIDFKDAAIVNNDMVGNFQTTTERIQLVRTTATRFQGVAEGVMGGLRDVDGSLSGTSGPRLVMGNLPLQINGSCQQNPTQQSASCPANLPVYGLNLESWAPLDRLHTRKHFWSLPATRSDGAQGAFTVRGRPGNTGAILTGMNYDFDLPVYSPNSTKNSKAMRAVLVAEPLGLTPVSGLWVTLSLPVEVMPIFVYPELIGQYDPKSKDFKGPDVSKPLTPVNSLAAVRDGNGMQSFFDASRRRVYVKVMSQSGGVYVCETVDCK
jgi:hypothetical protein